MRSILLKLNSRQTEQSIKPWELWFQTNTRGTTRNGGTRGTTRRNKQCNQYCNATLLFLSMELNTLWTGRWCTCQCTPPDATSSPWTQNDPKSEMRPILMFFGVVGVIWQRLCVWRVGAPFIWAAKVYCGAWRFGEWTPRVTHLYQINCVYAFWAPFWWN